MKPAIQIFSYLVLCLFAAIGIVYFWHIGSVLLTNGNSLEASEIKQYSPWTLGLPIAALGSFAFVVALPTTQKEKLTLTIGNTKLEGPACQILFWLVCFLSIVTAIRLTQYPVGN